MEPSVPPDDFTPKTHQFADSPLVSLGGKLPFCLELRSSTVLDILTFYLESKLSDGNPKAFRTRLRQGLYRKSRPGFYHELTPHIHLAYADQRDGHGSQHYWRIFYDAVSQPQLEQLAQGSSLTTHNPASKGAENAPFEWGGLYLRSTAEVAIAKELNSRGLLFFANVRGRVSTEQAPISHNHSNGRVELDFLVFSHGKAIILEIDSCQHNDTQQRYRDYARDRLLLSEGLPTARFTAQECLDTPSEVVTEFLTFYP